MAFTFAKDMESISYTSGSAVFTAGETLTGASSGATADVITSTITSGSVVGGDAAGKVYITGRSGTFESENLNGSDGGNNMATASGASAVDFTDLNKLRKMIGDTNSSFDLFSDNELNGLITMYTEDDSFNIKRAASMAMKALSVDPDRLATKADEMAGALRMEALMDMYWSRAQSLIS